MSVPPVPEQDAEEEPDEHVQETVRRRDLTPVTHRPNVRMR